MKVALFYRHIIYDEMQRNNDCKVLSLYLMVSYIIVPDKKKNTSENMCLILDVQRETNMIKKGLR